MRPSVAVRLLAYTDSTAWGGAEECLATLFAELDDGFAAAVVGVDATVVGRIASARPGTSVRVVPQFGGKFDVRSMYQHARAFRALRPDICHINMRVPWSCQAGILAALLTRRARVVAVEHLPLHSRSPFVRWTRRHASRLYDAHVAVGKTSARTLEAELGLPHDSVRAIPNGVRPLGERVASRSGPPSTIGTVGRIVPEKGHEVLVRALCELPGVRAIIVGDGPSTDDVQQLARRLGVSDRLELRGWSSEPETQLATFDVFVLPSFEEGMPLVVLKAMFSGVPVVATRVGSVGEMIEDEVSGLLVPPGDAAALAAAVRRLLDDGELARRFARAAREAACASFTARAMADRYAALYREVVH